MATEVSRRGELQPAVGQFKTGFGHSTVRPACSRAVVEGACTGGRQCGDEVDERFESSMDSKSFDMWPPGNYSVLNASDSVRAL
jgi:hypothetical protein